MRVKDLAAELISEIAEEHEYYVYKFEKISPGCGFIIYEMIFVDSESGSNEEITKYKSLSYEGPIVKLQTPEMLMATPESEINLHDPDSVQKIEAYFDDLVATFATPFGLGIPNMNTMSMGGYGFSTTVSSPYSYPHSPPQQASGYHSLNVGYPNTPAPAVYGGFNSNKLTTTGALISSSPQATPP